MVKERDRLRYWQDRYQQCRARYSDELEKIKEREELYKGSHTAGMGKKAATSSWNIVSELVESQIDNSVPAPKVSPRVNDERRKKLAQTIVDMIKSELDRMPSEELNDLDERMAKVAGGTVSLVEWDTSVATHDTVGDISVRLIKAAQFIPQISVHDYRKMDYFFITFDETKERIKKRYNKDVTHESTDPQSSEADDQADELVTQVIAYYKNGKGGLGCFSWAGDTVLVDDDNYEARKEKVCARCGKIQADGEKRCICGSKEWTSRDKEYEYLTEDMIRSDGTVIPALSPERDEEGNYIFEDYEEPVYDDYNGELIQRMEYVFDDMGLPLTGADGAPVVRPMMQTKQRVKMGPTRIPYYYPKCYPISIRKNISRQESVLGISDVDLIKDHQIAINKMLTKIDEILLKAARVIPMLKGKPLRLSDDTYQFAEMDPAAMQAARVLDLTADTTRLVAEVQQRYYMAKSVLGITDTFQGKADATAESGAAKQAQIAQAAGRQRSKRVMKNAAAAEKYEMFFKYMLAYSDEPRSYVSQDVNGQKVESVFNKYDFLEQDEHGNWYYDDEYIFSVDETGIDADNKQFMLEDLRTDFGLGAYGDRSDPQTILSYWKEKDIIGYPNAGRMVEEWTQRVEEQRRQAVLMQQLQQAAGVADPQGTITQEAMPL